MEVGDVEVQGTRVRVQTWGEQAGKPLFYWHGGGGGSEEAPVLAPPLVAAGYTLFAVEAPGYGGSPALDPEGYVFVHGELWRARPAGNEPLRPGQRVRVASIGPELTLVVEPVRE